MTKNRDQVEASRENSSKEGYTTSAGESGGGKGSLPEQLMSSIGHGIIK